MINTIEIRRNTAEREKVWGEKFSTATITVDGIPFPLKDGDAIEIMELLKKTEGYRRAKNGADAYSK